LKRLGRLDLVVFLVYLAMLGGACAIGIRDAAWYLGVSFSVICALLWFLARWQLGDSFSVDAQARELVTHGLYSRLRHPIYVFGTFAFLFALLALSGWRALAIWPFVLLIQVGRARREERVLAAAFGPAYQEYREATWF
jgi:protein-S-isoprenylcysteine O-methyltransferase Ste14